jgi:DNA-binding NarL/FixJ family response regulator
MIGKTYFSHEASQSMILNKDETNPVITRRETEVLELISTGMTNIEIADKLFVSTSTVDTHRKNLLAKFEAKNVASLVRMAIKMKYI